MTAPTILEVTRLRADVYDKLESQLPKPVLTHERADPVHAAYLLGIQHVLGLLRQGYVTK